MQSGTYRPPLPDAANLPISLSSSQKQDLDWVLDHMSIDPQLTAGIKVLPQRCSSPSTPSTYNLSPCVQVTVISC